MAMRESFAIVEKSGGCSFLILSSSVSIFVPETTSQSRIVGFSEEMERCCLSIGSAGAYTYTIDFRIHMLLR